MSLALERWQWLDLTKDRFELMGEVGVTFGLVRFDLDLQGVDPRLVVFSPDFFEVLDFLSFCKEGLPQLHFCGD